MGKDKSETIENIEKFILHVFGPNSDELAVFKELRSNRPSSIDNRKILLDTPELTIETAHHRDFTADHLLLFTDVTATEHSMKLDKHKTAQLISYLQSLKFE